MGHFPGWVLGAAGTAALVGTFYAGGAMGAGRDQTSTRLLEAPAAATAADLTSGLDVTCEPGQRAVVRQATATSGASVTCASLAPAAAAIVPAGLYAGAPAPLARTVSMPSGGYARPAVLNEPVEVYRPRATPVRYQTREVARPTRSVKKSVAIIAGSTAAGATIGGLAKGKKGALIGGLLGGGAATVWDQVTRRRDDGR